MGREEMKTVYTSCRYPIVLIMVLTISALAFSQEYFQWTHNTGEYATVGMLVDNEILINGEPIAPGDEIGVFTPDGLCVGGLVWCGEKNRAVTVWGNDPLTEEIDGMRQNEKIHYRIWQKATDTVVEAKQVNYELGDELYRSFGIYIVASLNAYKETSSLVQVAPGHGTQLAKNSINFKWKTDVNADVYSFLLSTKADFADSVLFATELSDTSLTVGELEYNNQYYWRVGAVGYSGDVEWSSVWSFTTVSFFTDTPVPASPGNGAVNISTDTLLTWNELNEADTYHVQLSTEFDFSSTVLDSAGIVTPDLAIFGLDYGTEYFWRFRAVHGEHESEWSPVWSFSTNTITSANSFTQGLPVDFSLDQNYPNPFNPTTTIRFALPTESTVRMEIYNMLGQLVTTLVDGEQMRAGIYEKVWDGHDAGGMQVSSGTYIYRVIAGDYVETKRMILMK
jgi:hypothetical protein